MRRSFLLAVLVAVAAAAPARAQTVTLWGCHGPGGDPLPLSASASGTVETAVTEVGGGCAAVGGALRIAFARTDPAHGQWASVRFAPPPRVALEHVWLGRSANGPGYWAQTSSTPLETLAGGSLDGSLFAAATGDWVEVGLRCDTPDPRCDAPDARVDLRFAALTVRDAAVPTFSAVGVPRVAKGTFEVVVDADDRGLGVARASATLGGTPVATAQAGQGRCRELSPADATADLPLSEDCPPSDRLVLAIDTTVVADGVHTLELLVADGAGNTAAKSYDVPVANVPPTPVPSAAGPVSRRDRDRSTATAAADDRRAQRAEALQGRQRRDVRGHRALPEGGAVDVLDHAEGHRQAPGAAQGRHDRHGALDRQARQEGEGQPAPVRRGPLRAQAQAQPERQAHARGFAASDREAGAVGTISGV